jgi:hypothetical protein
MLRSRATSPARVTVRFAAAIECVEDVGSEERSSPMVNMTDAIGLLTPQRTSTVTGSAL